ncbi:MAG: Bug family tripartite tricarboxylate transporter substrate binding protein [Rhodospirillaceae bacterium]
MIRFAIAVTLCLFASVVSAQTFPSKNLRLVVPFPPAGAVDVLARTLSQPLSAAFGQSVIVENRPGANTVIGAELVARAPADGHTLLLMAPSFTINPVVRSSMPYDTFRDFSGVTRLASNPLVVSVHPALPAKSVKELIALARARPGELTFATASILGGQRLAGELLWQTANVKIVNVPYNGGAPAATAVMGGHNPILVANVLESAPFINAGRLRGIAVTGLQRSENVPAVPTVAESGYPGFEALNWFGAVARAGTPKSLMERLSSEITRALQTAEVRDILAKQGLNANPLMLESFDAYMKAEMERNERIIKALGLKID